MFHLSGDTAALLSLVIIVKNKVGDNKGDSND